MGICSSRVHRQAIHGELSVGEAFALVHGADARGARGAFLFEIAGASAADARERFLVEVDAEDARARVRTVGATEPLSELPNVRATIVYKSASVFFAEARGTLPTSAYVTGLVRVRGDIKAAEALEHAFEPLAAELARRDARQGRAGAADADEPFDADAAGLALAGPAPRWYAAHTRAWWVRHFGTDNLLGTWLTLVGSLLWVLDAALLVARDPGAIAWAQLASACLFLLSFGALVEAAYPEGMVQLIAGVQRREREQAAAAKAEGTEHVWTASERLGLSNNLGLGISLMWLGVLPFLLAAAYVFARDGAGSAVGWSVLFGCALFAPAIVLLQLAASEPSLHDMAKGGDGSRALAALAERYPALGGLVCGACCCCCGGLACCIGERGKPGSAFARHLGTDIRAGLWYFVALMLPFSLLAVAAVLAAPASFVAHIEMWEALSFTAGLALQLRANYPEHFNTSLFFGRLVE